MAAQSIKTPIRAANAAKMMPAALVFGGAIGLVGTYVYIQLRNDSRTIDRYFAQYNTPQSEESRKRVFDGATVDPRKSGFNILSW